MKQVKIGNLTLTTHRDIKPSTLVEVRVRRYDNRDASWWSIAPSHVVKFKDLERVLEYVRQEEGVIEYAWSLVGSQEYYQASGPAGW